MLSKCMKKIPRHQESVQFKIPENLLFIAGKTSPSSHIKIIEILIPKGT